MGYSYFILSIIVSIFGPLYYLNEKIFELNELERISRQKLQLFNNDMRPLYDEFQLKIMKPRDDPTLTQYPGMFLYRLGPLWLYILKLI